MFGFNKTKPTSKEPEVYNVGVTILTYTLDDGTQLTKQTTGVCFPNFCYSGTYSLNSKIVAYEQIEKDTARGYIIKDKYKLIPNHRVNFLVIIPKYEFYACKCCNNLSDQYGNVEHKSNCHYLIAQNQLKILRSERDDYLKTLIKISKGVSYRINPAKIRREMALKVLAKWNSKG